jgi:ankyrin repeat protein
MRTLPPLPLRPMPAVVPWNQPLQQALWRGDDEEALRLIASRQFIRAHDIEGVTALHWACQWRRLRVVPALIAAGADIGARNICGRTPLSAAVFTGSTELVSLLLAHGADPNVRDVHGCTVLHYVAFIEDRERAIAIATLLIDASANVHAIEDEEHMEALAFIEENGHPGFTDTLNERGILRGFW